MATRPKPSQSEVERAFADAMSQAGFLPGPIQSNTENFVRFDAPGDKQGKGNGFYKLKLGDYPVGWFGDWKNGEQHQWQFTDPDAPPLTEQERKAIKREQAALKAQAAQARELKQAEVAENASNMWGRADASVEGHPYLARKGIEIPRGLRAYTAKDGTRLLAVPMWAFDLNGDPKLTSLQLIDGDGRKSFLKAGRVAGTFFSIKGDTSIIIICEGVATAFSIWEATGLSVVAAFNSGNLIEVAKEFQRNRPGATLMICADDDAIAPPDWAERGSGRPWENTGVKKAAAAAKAVGCRYIRPVFQDGQARGRTDYNDLFMLEGKQAVAGQVLGAFRSVEAEDAAPGAKIVDIDRVQDESWRTQLPQKSNGNADGANVYGVHLYIKNHRLLKGRLRYNEFSKGIEVDGNPIKDEHADGFRRLMHKELFMAKIADVIAEMRAEAMSNSYDPLIEYLSGLKWDEKPRIDTWLSTYLGVDDTPYSRAIGAKFLIGAVARAYAPVAGVKLDTMIVLEGPQGLGKSTAFRYLFGDRFFVDNLPDFHSKDSMLQLGGSWCLEVAELASLPKSTVADVKQFLSRLVDKFRPPFGRNPIMIPRRCVLVGTVNPEDGYLRDPTGNRRFWPVACKQIDLNGILRDRDQLWAEAARAYGGGETWYLDDPEIEKLAKAEQEERREKDNWEDLIARWIAQERVTETTCSELFAGPLNVLPALQDTRASRRAGAAMRALGWQAVKVRRGSESRMTNVFRSPGYAASLND